jgi:hypothetical protein
VAIRYALFGNADRLHQRQIRMSDERTPKAFFSAQPPMRNDRAMTDQIILNV